MKTRKDELKTEYNSVKNRVYFLEEGILNILEKKSTEDYIKTKENIYNLKRILKELEIEIKGENKKTDIEAAIDDFENSKKNKEAEFMLEIAKGYK